MDKLTQLRVAQAGGVLIIILGLIIFGVLGTIEWLGVFFKFVGGLMILVGLAWVWKINKIIAREKGKTLRARTFAIVFLALLASGVAASSVFYAQQFSTECMDLYKRVKYIEYTIIGFLIIAGFLAFAPILLGRTILGPIFQELQYMAGGMLLLLIFVLLVIFPLDPMFVLNDPNNPTMCYISLNNLKNQGPPLLQIILKLFSPPPYAG